MAVIKLVDKIKIVNAANNNEITTGIFLDLSKAFDTIKGALDNILKFYFWLNFIYHVKCKC